MEDIFGDREAERLSRTEYLDEANLYRIDERIEQVMTGDRWLQRGVLGSVAGEISKAKSQVDKLRQLNEEGIVIRATIRLLNRLFIDVMEGKLKPGQEEFSNRIIDISKAAILPQEDRRILELYIGLAYGEAQKARALPFECAKRQGVFKERVEKIEREIKTEFDTQRAAFARRVWQIDIEGILKANVRSNNNYRRNRDEPEINRYEIDEERRRLTYFRDRAIEKYEKGIMPKGEISYGLSELFDLLERIGKDFKPLVRRRPQDFTIQEESVVIFNRDEWWDAICGFGARVRNDLTTRGYTDIVESIDGLVKLCEHLAKPDNHLQVKTRQRTQREVPTRTVADMVNEMAGKLTELPRYEAYAKVVEEKGGEAAVWKGRIRSQFTARL